MTEIDITQLRADIDEIDAKMIELLNTRSHIVKQVGMTKKKRQQDGQAFIRSGREASMVRRIFEALEKGVFPAPAAAQIWRIIISASLSLESALTVSAYAPEHHQEIYWLAREYFGGITPVTKQPTARRVLGDVLGGKSEVGVMPLPEGSRADNGIENLWWLRLPEGIKIFACVPFILPKGAEIKALAVARVEPEATGNDVSFLSIETDMDVSQSRMKAVFAKRQVNVRWIAVESFPSGHRAHLIEIKGFVTARDKEIEAFKTEIGASILAISDLGAYAVPIIL